MSNSRIPHAPMTQFPVVDDCLQIDGMPLTEFAVKVGRTPFYAYNLELITQRVGLLRRHLPSTVHLHYAMKANPMPSVVQHAAKLVDGLDVASGGELKVALATGINPETISFAGPGKNNMELEAAVTAGIIVNLESEREIERVAAIGLQLGKRPLVAVRVNPDFELKSSGMKMSGGPKQFGIDAERVPAALSQIGRLGLDFQGFHIFCGSQNLRAEAIIDAQTKTLELATDTR